MTTLPVMPNVPHHILVASPNTLVRRRVMESLQSPARRIAQACGGAEALVHLERGPWQVLYLDPRLPDLDAEELSETIRRRYPATEIVMLNPESDSGGFDKEDSRSAAEEILPERDPVARRREGESAPVDPLPGMIGHAAAMQTLYRMASLAAPRNTTVLITGPTGSGKELVARAIHELSPRAARAFVVVNCAAIPEALLESELFGYGRGAFTGALQSYRGRIQAAQGGTLFLDEIGEMPLSLQPKLLRFLEQKELQRLGSSETVRVDTRVLAATNANLFALIRQGRFREDLYYRLCTFPVQVPALCERPEDIDPLAQYFVKKHAARSPAPELSFEFLELLKTRRWPGNVRELQNVIERALILADGEAVLRPEHLLLSEGMDEGTMGQPPLCSA